MDTWRMVVTSTAEYQRYRMVAPAIYATCLHRHRRVAYAYMRHALQKKSCDTSGAALFIQQYTPHKQSMARRWKTSECGQTHEENTSVVNTRALTKSLIKDQHMCTPSLAQPQYHRRDGLLIYCNGTTTLQWQYDVSTKVPSLRRTSNEHAKG